MSPPLQSPDPFANPPRDEQERAEANWLLARERDPLAPPPSAQVASDYAELEDMIRTLPEGPPDDSWHAEVLRQLASGAIAPVAPIAENIRNGKLPQQAPATVAAEPKPLWWRRRAVQWTPGGALAAAAVLAIVLIGRPPSRPAEQRALTIAIIEQAPVRSSGEKYTVGDRIRVTASSLESGDLRVFRSDGTSSNLIARCPDGATCKATDRGELVLDLLLQAPGRYVAILVEGKGQIPPDATMNDFLDAALSAGDRIPLREPFEVE